MTNTRLIKAKMVELGLTQEDMAKSVGISTNSFSHKILNQFDFKQGEIETMIQILGIQDQDICKYFFANLVD